ncbi:MAG: MBL fold metallo-hydrolase [Thermodesulfobacteriota bacterium]
MKVKMLGHSTLLLEVDGKKILTDPWLTDPLYFGFLSHPGPFSTPALPPLDLVMVSHGHQDHFDQGTLAGIDKKTPVLICARYEKAARKAGFTNVTAASPGEEVSLADLSIKVLPGKHPGGITTFLVRGNGGSVFFGGDTVLTDDLFRALSGAAPDACLLPISGGTMGPFPVHMGPEDAVKLAKASGTKRAIPIHYHFEMKWPSLNRFLFQTDCLEKFTKKMAQDAPEIPVTVLAYNETWEK